MENLPHPWGAYARLQTALDERSRVDDQSWGLEAGLDRLLESDVQPPTEAEIARAVRSENRGERHRARLRRVHLAVEGTVSDAEAVVAARQALRITQAQVDEDDWVLLRAIGEGYEYGEIAVDQDISAGHLRVRVLRLRGRLTDRSSDFIVPQPAHRSVA